MSICWTSSRQSIPRHFPLTYSFEIFPSASKGQPRRKEIRKPKGFTSTGGPAGDDKKLQAALKKLNVQSMAGIEEVNMFKDEGSKILHFANPKGMFLRLMETWVPVDNQLKCLLRSVPMFNPTVHAAANVNTFAAHGVGQEKDLTELVPGILPQLGAESIANLRRLASSLGVSYFLLFPLI